MTQAGLALPLSWLALLCLGLPWLALGRALSCSLYISLNEKILFIIMSYREERLSGQGNA